MGVGTWVWERGSEVYCLFLKRSVRRGKKRLRIAAPNIYASFQWPGTILSLSNLGVVIGPNEFCHWSLPFLNFKINMDDRIMILLY